MLLAVFWSYIVEMDGGGMMKEVSEEKLSEEADGEAGGSRVASVFLRAGALRRGASVEITLAGDVDSEQGASVDS